MSWRDQAACKGMDVSLFFVEVGRSTREAKAACAVCPVTQECLRDGLRNGCDDGIYGGLAPRERRGMRSARPKVAVCGTAAGYQRHRRAGENPCPACRHAHGEAERSRNARRRNVA